MAVEHKAHDENEQSNPVGESHPDNKTKASSLASIVSSSCSISQRHLGIVITFIRGGLELSSWALFLTISMFQYSLILHHQDLPFWGWGLCITNRVGDFSGHL